MDIYVTNVDNTKSNMWITLLICGYRIFKDVDMFLIMWITKTAYVSRETIINPY